MITISTVGDELRDVPSWRRGVENARLEAPKTWK